MATTTATRPVSSQASTFDADKVRNLKTTDKDIMAMIKKTYSDGSTEDRALLQQLLGERSNNASLLSNMYKTLAETTRSIIVNLRQ